MNCKKTIFNIFFLFILFFGAFGLAKYSQAATLTAINCSQAEVQSKLTSAARGDTVIIPAGDCTWNSTVSFNKALTIQGAGKDKTFIRSNISVPAGTMARNLGVNQLLYFNSSSPSSDANVVLRITGITFDMNKKSCGIALRNTSATNPMRKVIIDNNAFIDGWDGWYPQVSSDWTAVHTMFVYGAMYGVIHSNTFSGFTQIDGFGLEKTNFTNSMYNTVHGSPNTMYFEDNILELEDNQRSDGMSMWHDWADGEQSVIRFNTYNSHRTTNTHGRLYSPHHPRAGELYGEADYGSKGGEFYGNFYNILIGDPSRVFLATPRSGKNLIYYNKISASSGYFQWTLYNYYPSYTGINCGSDTLWEGLPYCGIDGQPEHLYRSYEWNNRKSTGIISPYSTGQDYLGNQLRQNIEFYNFNQSFTGTNGGVGCGTLANRPRACTKGVTYWVPNPVLDPTAASCANLSAGGAWYGANNTLAASVSGNIGTLHLCTATGNPGVWNNGTATPYYTPYTYPHPLRGGTTNTSPAAPTGVRVI